MGMITAYLDDSGHEGDRIHNACVIASFIGELSSWRRLESEWPLVLARYGLSYLHMKEHASDPEVMRCPDERSAPRPALFKVVDAGPPRRARYVLFNPDQHGHWDLLQISATGSRGNG